VLTWMKSKPVTSNEKKNVNFNSVLMFIVLGVLGWLGVETRATSLGLAEMRTAQNMISRSNSEAFGRMEDHLNNSVPRREFDLRIVAIEARLTEINVRLHELDLVIKRNR